MVRKRNPLFVSLMSLASLLASGLVVFMLLFVSGFFSPDRAPVVLVSESAQKPYDGTPLTAPTVSLAPGYEEAIEEGHTLICSTIASITNVGTVANTFTARIIDENGVDVSDKYNLQLLPGTLEITKRSIRISTETAVKYYDGLPLSCEEYDFSGDLLDGHELIVEDFPELNVIGNMQNAPKTVKVIDNLGREVTGFYDIVIDKGILMIAEDSSKLPSITIQSLSATMSIDDMEEGEALTCHEYEIIDGEELLEEGHEIKVEFTGSQVGVGHSYNTFDVAILDGDGNVVTQNYRLTIREGVLLVLDSSSKSKGPGALDENALVDPEPKTEEELNTEALAIRTTEAGRFYLRHMSYGAYSGANWSPATAYGAADISPLFYTGLAFDLLAPLAAENPMLIGMLPPYSSVSMDIRLSGTSQSFLPYYTSAVACPEDLTSDISMPDLTIGLEYTVPLYTGYELDDLGHLAMTLKALSSHPLYAEYAEMYAAVTAAESAYRAHVYENYLDVPKSFTGSGNLALLLLALQLPTELPDSEQDYEAYLSVLVNSVKTVEEYLRDPDNYTYDMEYATCDIAGHNDGLSCFLFCTKTGVCRHYAGAATLILRAIGIPARYTQGFAATVEEAGVFTAVQNRSAHAWVEIYLDGMGWVPIEVTGSADLFGSNSGEGDAKRYETLTPTAVGATPGKDGGFSVTYNGSAIPLVPVPSTNGLTYKDYTFDLYDADGNLIASDVSSVTEPGTYYVRIGEITVEMDGEPVYRRVSDGNGGYTVILDSGDFLFHDKTSVLTVEKIALEIVIVGKDDPRGRFYYRTGKEHRVLYDFESGNILVRHSPVADFDPATVSALGEHTVTLRDFRIFMGEEDVTDRYYSVTILESTDTVLVEEATVPTIVITPKCFTETGTLSRPYNDLEVSAGELEFVASLRNTETGELSPCPAIPVVNGIVVADGKIAKEQGFYKVSASTEGLTLMEGGAVYAFDAEVNAFVDEMGDPVYVVECEEAEIEITVPALVFFFSDYEKIFDGSPIVSETVSILDAEHELFRRISFDPEALFEGHTVTGVAVVVPAEAGGPRRPGDYEAHLYAVRIRVDGYDYWLTNPALQVDTDDSLFAPDPEAPLVDLTDFYTFAVQYDKDEDGVEQLAATLSILKADLTVFPENATESDSERTTVPFTGTPLDFGPDSVTIHRIEELDDDPSLPFSERYELFDFDYILFPGDETEKSEYHRIREVIYRIEYTDPDGNVAVYNTSVTPLGDIPPKPGDYKISVIGIVLEDAMGSTVPFEDYYTFTEGPAHYLTIERIRIAVTPDPGSLASGKQYDGKNVGYGARHIYYRASRTDGTPLDEFNYLYMYIDGQAPTSAYHLIRDVCYTVTYTDLHGTVSVYENLLASELSDRFSAPGSYEIRVSGLLLEDETGSAVEFDDFYIFDEERSLPTTATILRRRVAFLPTADGKNADTDGGRDDSVIELVYDGEPFELFARSIDGSENLLVGSHRPLFSFVDGSGEPAVAVVGPVGNVLYKDYVYRVASVILVDGENNPLLDENGEPVLFEDYYELEKDDCPSVTVRIQKTPMSLTVNGERDGVYDTEFVYNNEKVTLVPGIIDPDGSFGGFTVDKHPLLFSAVRVIDGVHTDLGVQTTVTLAGTYAVLVDYEQLVIRNAEGEDVTEFYYVTYWSAVEIPEGIEDAAGAITIDKARLEFEPELRREEELLVPVTKSETDVFYTVIYDGKQLSPLAKANLLNSVAVENSLLYEGDYVETVTVKILYATVDENGLPIWKEVARIADAGVYTVTFEPVIRGAEENYEIHCPTLTVEIEQKEYDFHATVNGVAPEKDPVTGLISIKDPLLYTGKELSFVWALTDGTEALESFVAPNGVTVTAEILCDNKQAVKILDAGKYVITLRADDPSGNYKIEDLSFTFVVEKRELALEILATRGEESGDTFFYTGEDVLLSLRLPDAYSTLTYTADLLLYTEVDGTWTLYNSGSVTPDTTLKITDAGTYYVKVTNLRLVDGKDENGEDKIVTDLYNINYKSTDRYHEAVTIKPAEIKIRPVLGGSVPPLGTDGASYHYTADYTGSKIIVGYEIYSLNEDTAFGGTGVTDCPLFGTDDLLGIHAVIEKRNELGVFEVVDEIKTRGVYRVTYTLDIDGNGNNYTVACEAVTVTVDAATIGIGVDAAEEGGTVPTGTLPTFFYNGKNLVMSAVGKLLDGELAEGHRIVVDVYDEATGSYLDKQTLTPKDEGRTVTFRLRVVDNDGNTVVGYPALYNFDERLTYSEEKGGHIYEQTVTFRKKTLMPMPTISLPAGMETAVYIPGTDYAVYLRRDTYTLHIPSDRPASYYGLFTADTLCIADDATFIIQYQESDGTWVTVTEMTKPGCYLVFFRTDDLSVKRGEEVVTDYYTVDTSAGLAFEILSVDVTVTPTVDGTAGDRYEKVYDGEDHILAVRHEGLEDLLSAGYYFSYTPVTVNEVADTGTKKLYFRVMRNGEDVSDIFNFKGDYTVHKDEGGYYLEVTVDITRRPLTPYPTINGERADTQSLVFNYVGALLGVGFEDLPTGFDHRVTPIDGLSGNTVMLPSESGAYTVGFTVIRNGVDVTENFDCTPSVTATVTVLRAQLSVMTQSFKEIYNGTALSAKDMPGALTVKVLNDGGRDVTARFSAKWFSATDAGVYGGNTVELSTSFMHNGNVYEFDDLYEIAAQSIGSFEIERRKITITTHGQIITFEKYIEYTEDPSAAAADGVTIDGSGCLIARGFSQENLAPGHSVVEALVKFDANASLDGPGEAENGILKETVHIVNGENDDVTSNYEIGYNFGTLIILDPQ